MSMKDITCTSIFTSLFFAVSVSQESTTMNQKQKDSNARLNTSRTKRNWSRPDFKFICK